MLLEARKALEPAGRDTAQRRVLGPRGGAGAERWFADTQADLQCLMP